MPPRKRRVSYPPPRTANRPNTGDAPVRPSIPSAVSINLAAGGGRTGLSIGDRVRIAGSGLYAGEAATIERFAGGVIPAALVRTDAGHRRTVRTIDLEPISREASPD